MLMRMGEFREQVTENLAGLVAALQDITGRRSNEEQEAWRASLPIVRVTQLAKRLALIPTTVPSYSSRVAEGTCT